ncbi:hypothetical protein [Dyadobacter flavalbus]|uniref:hypothetical protein n=1 Tax=Dyadobacter flavalbus TaxID=2579942 RepID=UPI001E35ECB5|nr:hypothetical protein [Dyadobacter flavalbus]
MNKPKPVPSPVVGLVVKNGWNILGFTESGILAVVPNLDHSGIRQMLLLNLNHWQIARNGVLSGLF